MDRLLRKVFTGAGLVCCLIGSSLASTLSGPAPDFTLMSKGGDNMRLAEHRGEVVMINFWASWCGPCREEMPHLEALQQRYSKAGFTVLGINVEQDSKQAVRMLENMSLSFPILFDPESVVSKLYDVKAMPSTVMIDRDGNMRYLHRGYKPGYEEAYREQIKELIRE